MTTAHELMPDVELRLLGRVTGEAVRRLSDALHEVVGLRPEHLIVDMQRCTALEPDVSALLERTQEDLARYGGRLVLRGPGPGVVRDLMRSGLLRHVEIDLPATTPEGP